MLAAWVVWFADSVILGTASACFPITNPKEKNKKLDLLDAGTILIRKEQSVCSLFTVCQSPANKS